MQPSKALNYDFTVAKYFLFTTILFGIIGMTIGVVLAFELAYPDINGVAGEYSTFSRLRHVIGYLFYLVLCRTKSFESFYG